MAEYQTTIQDPGALLRGSGLVEISPVQAVPSWTDIGAVTGLSWAEELEVNAEENDNTDSEDKVTKQTAIVACTSMEPLRDAVNTLIRGDLDTRTATAGAPVVGDTDVLVSGEWAAEVIYALDGQNSSGAEQSITSVVGSVDGALSGGDDYFIRKLSDGRWGILLEDPALPPTNLTTIAQDITVTYDYTPAASVKWQSGDKSTLTKFMVRITTKNDGNPFYFVGYYANIRTGKNFEYSKDDDADRRVGTPYEFICKTLPSGQGLPANEGLVYETIQSDGF